MNTLQAFILGTVQGLTEFLPVSSSGHLIFFPKIFGWSEGGLIFDTALHLATLLAVLYFFRKKLYFLVQSCFQNGESQKESRHFLLLLFITILPAGFVGFFAGDFIENNARLASVVGFNMIFFGVVLALSERYSQNLVSRIEAKKMGWKGALLFGMTQALALFPGVSRSGITMSTGLFLKISKVSAAEFSFLMSIPIIALAGASNLIKLFEKGMETVSLFPLVVGFFSAFVFGLFAISFFMKILQKWSFFPFAIYRIVVGILIFVFLV